MLPSWSDGAPHGETTEEGLFPSRIGTTRTSTAKLAIVNECRFVAELAMSWALLALLTSQRGGSMMGHPAHLTRECVQMARTKHRASRSSQMTNQETHESADTGNEEQLPTCATGCCCGFDGPVGKVRLIAMIVFALVALALMVHGFAG